MSKKTTKLQSRKSNRWAAGANSASAVILVRKIPEPTRLLLCVRAGGRCEFDGHNDYLFEHPITLHQGNFAEMAHIVAFKKAGPRGLENRPDDINNVENLMLLCPTCHKLVDDHPLEYPRERLEGYKREHEQRIFHLTSLGSDRKTSVIIFKAPIAGQTVAVPFDHVVEATFPGPENALAADHRPERPRRRAGIYRSRVLDDRETNRPALRTGRRGHAGGPRFHLGARPDPAAHLLGSAPHEQGSSGRVSAPSRHRALGMEARRTRSGISLRDDQEGGSVRRGSRSQPERVDGLDLPTDIRKTATIYELTLDGTTPSPTFLRGRQDLEAFRVAYQELLGTIGQQHGRLEEIDFFPAVPAPVAVLCGRELLPKVHPKLRVFDFNKETGGFTFQLTV